MSDGRFHSGQALAQEFNLSRSSIFNALAQAESMGLTIHAVRGRGYRMPEPVEWLDGITVADHLGTVEKELLGMVAADLRLEIHDRLAQQRGAGVADHLIGHIEGEYVGDFSPAAHLIPGYWSYAAYNTAPFEITTIPLSVTVNRRRSSSA